MMDEAYRTDFPTPLPEVRQGTGDPANTQPQKAPHGFPGFWTRTASAMVDGLVVELPILSIAPWAAQRMYSELGDRWLPMAFALLFATNVIGFSAYEAITSANGRRSVGKLAFGTKVVGPRFEPLSTGRAVARAVLSLVPGSLFFVVFNRSRRALHDLLSGTYVVRVRPRTRTEPFFIGLLLLTISLFMPNLAQIIRIHYVRAFWSPAGSMLPTIAPGDHFFVDRFVYTQRIPRRGDVVVFVSPVDGSTMLVKRIIGLPGETVEIREKTVLIDGETVDEPWETLRLDPNIASQGPRDNFGPSVIAPGSYFVLGDNRDRSYDSRFWGPVLEANVFGRVSFTYWSRDVDQGVQWGRIGRFIR